MRERAIFFEALDLEAPAERAAFLDKACAGDMDLRQRIEALLHSHAGAGDFLAVPAAQQLAAGAPARDAGATDKEAQTPRPERALPHDFLAPPQRSGSL